MRAPLAMTTLLLLAVPLAEGSHPALTVVAARLDSLFEPTEGLGARHLLSFTLRNDGEPSQHQVRIDELWVVNSLPFTRWAEQVPFEGGETRDFQVLVEHSPAGFLGPGWLCLQAGGWSEAYERCWSVWNAHALPDGAYPDQLPQADYGAGAPMGDTP